MKQTIKCGIRQKTLMVITIMVMTFSACSEKGDKFSFKSSEEALTTCHKELSKIKSLKEADVDKLVEITSTWVELKDSTISSIMRDSTVTPESFIAVDYYAVSDSFKTEITRLATSKERKLPEIAKLKVMTAKNCKNINESDDFKKACEFYAKSGETPVYKTLNQTIVEYERLLTNAEPKKENELYDFLQKEDRCFRSLLVFLKDTPQERLQNITDKTAQLFNRLYRNATYDKENKISERVLTYLTMRFNRRIMQNAEICRQDIKKKIQLTNKQKTNYRWMIIQPFISLDIEAMALLTDDQITILMDMANELPQLLAYIDDLDYDKSQKEETEKVNKMLCNYFLRSYLENVL